MGKQQHSKDKLWMNPTEYAESWGGYNVKQLPFKKLPLHCCALSLQKFESPVCDRSTGDVYEAANIIPFLKNFGEKSPVTGKALSISNLVAVKFTKMPKQDKDDLTTSEFCDAIDTTKPLLETAKVVLNAQSGHVYLFETVFQLNKKAGNFHDLITEEPFDWRKDIVVLQDPQQPELRDVTKFWHVKEKDRLERELALAMEEKQATTKGMSSSSSSSTAKHHASTAGRKDPKKENKFATNTIMDSIRDATKDNIFAEINARFTGSQNEAVKKKEKEDEHKFINITSESMKSALEAQKKRKQELDVINDAKRQKQEELDKKKREQEKNRTVNKFYTSGQVSRGFTSTMALATTGNNANRLNTDEEERELLYDQVKKRQKNCKGYVKMSLGLVDIKEKKLHGAAAPQAQPKPLGAINIELHADIAPHAVDNFLRHCESGYYTGTIFHRLVPNFVLQGGDPSGTGTGGQSAFDDGKPFKDEIDSRLQFQKKACLAMANPSVKNENKSQFFFTLRDDLTSTLFKKHTCFGRVVGNFALLETLGRDIATTGKDDPRPNKPKNYDITITEIEIFSNPFEDFLKQEEKDAAEKKRKEERGPEIWFNNSNRDIMKNHAARETNEVGKYLLSNELATKLIRRNELEGATDSVSMLDSLLEIEKAKQKLQDGQVVTRKELEGMSKEEREDANAARKRKQYKAFAFDDW
ncbi:unnamed protein product [Amoebophrya sp. A120]|nr:unnamed protein product [Amoebophrya sp. A120]|eukprot:GSA120T00014188001.1